MKFDIRIMTCDRSTRMANGINYIHTTIANFIAAGGALSNSVTLYVSHPNTKYVEIYRDQFKISSTEQELDGNSNFVRVSSQPTSDDLIIILEDDLDFSSDFMNKISSWVKKNYHLLSNNIISLYTPYIDINKCLEEGRDYWDYPVEAFYGTQAILGIPHLINECGQFIKNINGMLWDMAIKEWLTSTKRGIISSAPCFVQHIGIISSVHGQIMHTTAGFVK